MLADRERELFIKQENLEQFILKVLQEWKTPGLALAILNGTSTWTKVSIDGMASVNLDPSLTDPLRGMGGHELTIRCRWTNTHYSIQGAQPSPLRQRR